MIPASLTAGEYVVAERVIVIEVGDAATQVVTIEGDSAPTPVYVPGTGTADTAHLAERIDELAARPLDHVHQVPAPTLLVQIVHGLVFAPASVLCTDASGSLAEPDLITHPSPGVVEVLFGAPFSGTIRLS
ncbi:hypothetical protein [Pseudonocardia alni]|uniref:hypothetical protein n=1 Tax=Pseudonocardia alni TaxID=33907 RepID=UPI003322CAF4